MLRFFVVRLQRFKFLLSKISCFTKALFFSKTSGIGQHVFATNFTQAYNPQWYAIFLKKPVTLLYRLFLLLYLGLFNKPFFQEIVNYSALHQYALLACL
jgi:hypothetical protein